MVWMYSNAVLILSHELLFLLHPPPFFAFTGSSLFAPLAILIVCQGTGRVLQDPAKRLRLVIGFLGYFVSEVNDVVGLVNTVLSNQRDRLIDGLGGRIAGLDVVEAFKEAGDQFFCLHGEFVGGCSWLRFR